MSIPRTLPMSAIRCHRLGRWQQPACCRPGILSQARQYPRLAVNSPVKRARVAQNPSANLPKRGKAGVLFQGGCGSHKDRLVYRGRLVKRQDVHMCSPGRRELIHRRNAKFIPATGESRCGTYRGPAAKPYKGYSPLCWISFATSPVQPVWWLAPRPAPLSP